MQVVFRDRAVVTATEQPAVVPSESLDAGVGHQFSVDVRFVRHVPYLDGPVRPAGTILRLVRDGFLADDADGQTLPADRQFLRLALHRHTLDGQEFGRIEIHPVHVECVHHRGFAGRIYWGGKKETKNTRTATKTRWNRSNNLNVFT